MTIDADAVIVGAGPVGLFQVFELGLLGIKAHVVDSLPQVGGQCAELYPDKPIYDIPAIPVCTAQELIDRLMEQIRPFEPVFHLGQEVTELSTRQDGAFLLKTRLETEFHTRTAIIAGGVGAFRPRTLPIEGIERHEGVSLHYKVKDPDRFQGRHLVILGGGDSALDWALELYDKADSLVLIHRSTDFKASPASVARMQQLCAEGKMRFMEGNVNGIREQEGRLTGLEVKCADGATREVDLDHLLVFYGLSPKLGPIADWNLQLQKNQIEVDTEKFQTHFPGLFAVGDINTYPGKKKLILSGFHETALAAFGVHRHLYPDKKVFLQYTTTSPIMHKRLGVGSA